MTDTNRVQLTYAKEINSSEEAVYGVAPDPADSSYYTMRITGESMHQETSTITSAEIRADRQIADVVRSNLSVAGDTSIELSYSFGDLLASALMGVTWTAAVTYTPAKTLAVTSATSTFTQEASGNFSSFSVGQWIQTAGFANAASNGIFKIKSQDGNEMVVHGTLGADEDAEAAPTMVQGGQILNGNDQSSYTIERVYTDIDAAVSGRCAQYLGCMIDGMTVNATTEAVVTGSFSWIGSKGVSLNTEIGVAPVASSGNDVMNAIDDVEGVMEGTSYADQTITAFSMSLANNLRARLQIGTLGAIGIGTGTCNVSGTFQRYYSDAAMIDKYLNFDDSALAIVFQDADGNAYCFDFPKIIYTSAQRVAGGQNQDLIADMSWEAVRHDTEDKTIRITRWSV